MVSIIMLTYNHENFIGEAIESIVNQKVSFAFKLIIGEDCSQDATRKICREYKKSYPDKIELIEFNTNVGGQPNFFKCFELAKKSKYIGFCEGDDYWIDDYKLQKQIDFLEGNPEYAIVFGDAKVEFFDNSSPGYFLNSHLTKRDFTLDDLIGEHETWFMATATTMYRTSYINPLPNWLLKSKSGDIPLAILAARKGKIKFLKDVFAVYRKHSGGQSLTDHKDDSGFLKNRIFMYKMLKKSTKSLYKTRFNRIIAGYYFLLVYCKQYEDSFFKRFIAGFNFLFLSKWKSEKLNKTFIKDAFVPFCVLKLFRFAKRIFQLNPR